MDTPLRFRVLSRPWSSVIVLTFVLISFPRAGASDCSPQALFDPAVFYPTGNNARDLAVGDFNSDGILDVAVANSDFLSSSGGASSVSILLGNGSGGVGTGTFGSPVNYPADNRPVAIAAADFNRDGIVDLAVANWGSDDVSILLGRGSAGHGDGTFAPPMQFYAGSHPYGISSGDF